VTANLDELLARARQHDPEVAFALAELIEGAIAVPDRRISAAFRLKRRGGVSEHRATLISERDQALRALARLLYDDLPPAERARSILCKARRYFAATHSADDGNCPERALLQRIARTGIPLPGMRHLRRILSDFSDSQV
jgi:hypothetical protein